jgi:Domain of unknown function (DUF3883)
MADHDWTRDEVEAVVADYFDMLDAELRQEPYGKAPRNRRLQQRISRSRGSIEFKHQNISAVLVNFRLPFIRGYLPRQNYQLLLEQAVLEWLAANPRFFAELADSPVLAPTSLPPVDEIRPADVLVDPPSDMVEVAVDDSAKSTRFIRLDFARRDAENRKLGRLGEEWALEFERRRLHDGGRPDLARRIEWVSETRGDGVGYDIASFDASAKRRLIEVKTTGLGRHFPFLVTVNEVRVSEREAAAYNLYRIFDFGTQPRLYSLPGALTSSCRLEPTQYRARVVATRRR